MQTVVRMAVRRVQSAWQMAWLAHMGSQMLTVHIPTAAAAVQHMSQTHASCSGLQLHSFIATSAAGSLPGMLAQRLQGRTQLLQCWQSPTGSLQQSMSAAGQ